MSIFRNKKRTDFFNDLEKVNFSKIKVEGNDLESISNQTGNEAKNILTAIKNWEKNKTNKEKSESQQYLKNIKTICENFDKGQNNRITSLLENLKDELKKAAKAKFSLFTFGAVLDNKKNKKILEKISKDIENLLTEISKKTKNISIGSHREIAQEAAQKVIEKKKQEEAKHKAEEEHDKRNDPGIFKGLPNSGNYCYLNSALQQLYHITSFRNKVLNFDITGLDTNNEDNKKLIAVKSIFEHLASKKTFSTNELNILRSDLGYTGTQQDSGEHMLRIQEACKFAFKNKKTTSSTPDLEGIENINNFSLTDYNTTISKGIENFLNETLNRGRIIYLKLKDDKLFQVILMNHFNDTKKALKIQEKMEFKNIIDRHGRPVLQIVNKFKDKKAHILDTFKCELVSATIHHGSTINSGHYFVYKKSGSSWTEINDSNIYPRKWNEIEDDINSNATVLTYKLLN